MITNPRRRRLLGALLGPLAGLAAPAARAQPRPPATAPLAPEAARALAYRLAKLDEDGLDPRLYNATPEDQPALLRAAAQALADLLHGRVNGLAGRVDLRRDTAAIPLDPWLAELRGSATPATVLDRAALLPPDAAVLKRALAEARARIPAGGFPTISGNLLTTLDPGSTDGRVPQLRARLAATDPTVTADGNAAYDEPLAEAVKRFQADNGLEPDGRIGPITWAALNRPAEARIRQLRVALDMRRAQAAAPTERRIEVNIPFQHLAVLDGDRPVLEMKVVVGRPARATPMLRVRMTQVMFNPPWGVPARNAREDLLPRLRRNPRAVADRGFRIFGVVDGERVEIDPTTVDWNAITKENFPYAIRQDAGDSNALGRIKFIMPNGDDIYMHDTPEKHLFRSADRAHSSGCIRLEKPMEMLDIALAGVPGFDRARTNTILASRATSTLAMRSSIPVRLHYTTVLVTNGQVVVRGDIYGHDEAYARALDAPRPQRLADGGRI